MKMKFITIAVIISCFNSLCYAVGKDTLKQKQIAAQPVLKAWVPEQCNLYSFSVLEGKKGKTIDVLIEGRITGEWILSIINLKGQERYRKVLQPVNAKLVVEVSYEELKRGVYFLKIDSGDEIRMKRLVIDTAGMPMLVTASVED